MNHQGMSEICFEERYRVSRDETALALFARLSHGCAYADRMAGCLATGYLVAIAESICIGEMQHHVHPIAEVVVGRHVAIEHCQPVVPGDELLMRGFVERIGERSVTFRFSAHDSQGLVCEARIALVAAPRPSVEACIAGKRDALRPRPARAPLVA